MATTMFNFAARNLLGNLKKIRPVQIIRTATKEVPKELTPHFGGAFATLPNIHVRTLTTKKQRQVKNKEYYLTDSDDEAETVDSKKLKGLSPFWRRKMYAFHNLLDLNKDGVISFDDFQLLADRFINLGHISDKSADEFRELVQKSWETNWGCISKYNLITVEQYLEDMLHVVNDTDRAKKVHQFLPYLFEAVDIDHSGKISLEEFKLFFECLGHADADAVFTFRVIDMDADGKLDKKEFIKYGRDYFLTEDETRISKYFWGPLVE